AVVLQNVSNTVACMGAMACGSGSEGASALRTRSLHLDLALLLSQGVWRSDANMQCEPARQVYRTWMIDSRRWSAYRPRSGDVIIATYPKCGTTWMQRIVGLLIFQSPEPS